MSALLQTLTREGDVETADTSIQATWQLKFRQANTPVPSQKKIKIKKNKTNKIRDDEIVLFDFYFACNVTWYGLPTEKRQDKRKKKNWSQWINLNNSSLNKHKNVLFNRLMRYIFSHSKTIYMLIICLLFSSILVLGDFRYWDPVRIVYQIHSFFIRTDL